MRLINTNTLQLHEFISEVPKYAILSHRWRTDTGGEATLQQFQEFLKSIPAFLKLQRRSLSSRRSSPGVLKVLDFCRIAKNYRLEWAWCDTVCVDKTNNVELSEAINSMFRWYEDSALCIVYLQDVEAANRAETLTRSEWFTRGWTLQELIAPMHIIFCDTHWKPFGSKEDLQEELSSITGIPALALSKDRHVTSYSTAQRMSWAANRKTTRPEDVAYCLLGLFNANMELLYGEGAQKAFQRLQIKILEEMEDESLLAWDFDEEDLQDFVTKGELFVFDTNQGINKFVGACVLTGILAKKPRQFSRAGRILRAYDYYAPSMPPKTSCRGLELTREVRVLRKVTMTPFTSTYEAETDISTNIGAATVALLPLFYGRDDTMGPQSYIIIAEDLISRPIYRWCRLIPSEQWIENVTAELVNQEYDKFDQPLFVRMSWP